MHVGALHVFELPAGYKGRFVRDLRAHMAKRLPIVPALRRKVWWMPLNLAAPAWVDAEPDLSQHVVEIRLPKAARFGDGLRAARGAGGGAASGAARSQAAAVEVPRLRGPGAVVARPQAGGDVQPAAPCRRRRPGRGGAGQRHPRRDARAACDRGEAERAREEVPDEHGRVAARRDGAPDHAGDPDRERPARHGGHARRRRSRRPAGRLAEQRAVRRQGRLGQPRAGAEDSVQRLGHRCTRICRGVAAAGRAQGHRQGARGHHQRHGDDGGVHRAAAPPRQARARCRRRA